MSDDVGVGLHFCLHSPDPERLYRDQLETCRRLGIEPVSRDRALGLIQEWTEVLTGRQEPTTH